MRAIETYQTNNGRVNVSVTRDAGTGQMSYISVYVAKKKLNFALNNNDGEVADVVEILQHIINQHSQEGGGVQTGVGEVSER